MGGVAPYTYLLNTGDSLAIISGLIPDTYIMTVTDANGCTSTCEAIVNASDAPTCTVSVTDTSCGENNGSVTANASEGTPPYSYVWNMGQTSSTISNLSSGTYAVTITDATGCTSTCTGNVGESSSLSCNAISNLSLIHI